MLLYDITSKESFEDLSRFWINKIESVQGNEAQIHIIGNKCDMPDEDRQVTKEEGAQLARSKGYQFAETSAKENINLKDSVTNLIRKIMNNSS